MIRIAIVAASGPAFRAITAGALELPDALIVRHCHGRSPVVACVAAARPDLVIVDEMGWSKLALRCIAETRRGAPGALVVARVGRPDAGWLAEGLRAGACAVVPETAGPATLGVVLREVCAALAARVPPVPAVAA